MWQQIWRTKYLNEQKLTNQISTYTIKLQSHRNKCKNITDPFKAYINDSEWD